MKTFELVKRKDHWALYNEDGHKIAATIDGCKSKLSIKNCQAIERGYDLDDLASERLSTRFNENAGYHKFVYLEAYKEGFQKALEIKSDKKYAEIDLYRAFLINSAGNDTTLRNFFEQKVLPTFKQTEFEVEVEWEKDTELFNVCPKLDAEGCLILKRIEK